jgi:hypothetical protein
MELVAAVAGWFVVRWVLLPCLIGTLAYYVLAKLIVLAWWLQPGPHRREIERRRRYARDPR